MRQGEKVELLDEKQAWFDENGRRIPPSDLQSPVNKASGRFILSQPRVDYREIHARLREYLRTGDTISATEFADRAEAVLEGLRGDYRTKNITNGVHVPFLIAKIAVQDVGQALDEVFLPAVGESFKARFPEYDFKNERKGQLTGQARIADDCGYEKLIEAMARDAVVGCYFPTCLSGYSVDADRQQLLSLPETFLLAGGYEAAAGLVGCPDLLIRKDGYPPQLDLAALEGPGVGYGYHFAAYGYDLTFSARHHNGQSSDYCAGGLTVIE